MLANFRHSSSASQLPSRHKLQLGKLILCLFVFDSETAKHYRDLHLPHLLWKYLVWFTWLGITFFSQAVRHKGKILR